MQVNAISWAPHELGLCLATASSDSSITIITFTETDNQWKTQVIKNAHDVGCNAISWGPATPSGALVSSAEKPSAPVKQFVSGGGDNKVKVWR